MGPVAEGLGRGRHARRRGAGRRTRPRTAAAAGGDAAAGEQVFADNCAVCHGASGTGGNGGPDLTAIPAARQLRRSSRR